MSNVLIVVSTKDWEAARASLFTDDGCENAGVFLCGISRDSSETRLLVRRFLPVSTEHYNQRQEYHLEVSPRYYNHVIDECLKDKLTPVIIHSHPSHVEAWYSASDDFGESRLLPVLESLIPNSLPCSLVVTPTSVTGRRFVKKTFTALVGLKISGPSSAIIHFSPPDKTKLSPRHDRQIRAFGEEGQRLISRLKVGVIGLGGIGSIVTEQLARVGVRDFILVDDDRIEDSNVSRIFCSSPKDVGAEKVEVIGACIKELGVNRLKLIAKSAVSQNVLMALRNRDLLLSCVDNDRTRAILNRFAHQYLIPLIDHGTRLDGTSGHIRASAGRVSVVGSGMTCLRCSHHLNPERIRAESLPKSERRALAREGYIMGIDEPVPAVATLNTVVGGLGATAALNLFVGLTGGPQPLGQIFDARNGTVFVASPVHQPGCDVCDELMGVKALGDAQIVSAYN